MDYCVSTEQRTEMNEMIEKLSEEARNNFIKFLEEVKYESVNCGVVSHSNHSNFSMW